MRYAVIAAVMLVSTLVLLGGLYAQDVRAQESGDLGKRLEELEGRDIILPGLPARAPRWRCEISKKFDCDITGCKPMASSLWVNLDFPRHRYERCSLSSCDTFEMTHSVHVKFTMIAIPGLAVHVANDGSHFVEALSAGDFVMVSWGHCRPR